ncbi:hypothetical protein BKA69DRAFT_1070956 [Paraphysoderma sedebokerense]|nr:hypothetical protein BKA69DRAFT_1070956 [Paraphysoderma sedebokerense]
MSDPNLWVEITDPQTHAKFFANPATGECVIDKRDDMVITESDPNGDWWELFDENHKLPYYYNTQTGETDWIRPTTGTIVSLINLQNSALSKRVSVIFQQRNSQDFSTLPVINETPANPTPTTTTTIPTSTPTNNNSVAPAPLPASSTPQDNNAKTEHNTAPHLVNIQPITKSTTLQEVAKREGISAPVYNQEAADAMNPLKGAKLISKSQSVEGSGAIKSLPSELKMNISQFKIDGFAKKYFSTHKRGIFRKKVPVEQMLRFSKDTIRQPLMLLNKANHKDALKCYKLIQKVMGDRSAPKTYKPSADIQWILDRGLCHGELRDEIYVQVCKQLTENPNNDSILKGWELISVIVVTFPPSKNFEDYLKDFIRSHFHADDLRTDKINVIARHCGKKLDRICKVGPKGKTPTVPEIERAMEAPFVPSVFGEPLSDIMENQQKEFPHIPVPRILPFLANAVLNLNGCQSEGIFRVPGDADGVGELKLRIEKNRYDMTGIFDVDVPASLLKFWMRDLAEPLIPEEFYQKCITNSDNVQACIKIIEELPQHNRDVAKYVIRFLQFVAEPQNQAKTRVCFHSVLV